MKRLKKQQEEIYANWKSTKGSIDSDLKHAINQHLGVLSKNTILLSSGERSECEDIKQCVASTVDFERIDGSFCSKCGCVFPL